MAFELKRRFYESLPLWVKRGALLVPFGWIAGRAYRETMARNDFFERASREEIQAYQEDKLGRMLRFATEQVPAYRHLRAVVERLRPFEAVKEFPLLDKETLQQDFDRYLPRDIDRIPHYKVSTGGTTGKQLTFFVDDVSQAVENAFQHRFWRRMGYTIRKRRATFRGVRFPNLKAGVYWQHNPIYNELQFSPFHMNDRTLPSYVEQIVRFRPEYLYGYPSAIDLLGEYVLREGIENRLPRLRAAFLISESIGVNQRERIEKAFRTRVFSFYGHSERLIMAGECECNATFHHFPDYGFLEIIGDDGCDCTKPGDRGELVGTGFLNRSLPLIRYRTGDYAVRCESRCECGRPWDRFSDVEGRWKQDMLIGKNGARISIAALNMHGPIFERVARYQYRQDRAGVCELRVMVSPGFSEADRRRIEEAYRAKTGDELDLAVRIVEDIPLTPRGKLKMLDSTLQRR